MLENWGDWIWLLGVDREMGAVFMTEYTLYTIYNLNSVSIHIHSCRVSF